MVNLRSHEAINLQKPLRQLGSSIEEPKNDNHYLGRCRQEALDDPSSSETCRQAAAISMRCGGALKRLHEPIVAPPNTGAFILRYVFICSKCSMTLPIIAAGAYAS